MTDDPKKCDVGPLAPDDGCDDSCMIEPGWECKNGSPTLPDVCNDICGDGIIVKKSHAKYCDDGNIVDGDG